MAMTYRVGFSLNLILMFASLSAFPGAPVFVNVTESAGIRFHHDNAASPRKYLIETMGSGCAWLDFDADGFLDLFFVNGGPTPSHQPRKTPRHALYRNQGDGTFVEVTRQLGVGGDGSFGMGAAVGDFDNDGFPDLYVSGHPRSTLYRNNRGERFVDVTDRSNVANVGKLASSAGWFDFDKDGWLDLMVLNYVDWDYERDVYCGSKALGLRQYCDPSNYSGIPPALFRNNRDGTFTNVTDAAGFGEAMAKGLGLVLADFDKDGYTDVFIANDGIRNFLYRNRRGASFEDATFESGVGYSEDGQAEAGMGCDTGDFMNTGNPGIYVTHLEFERNRLYRYQGNGSFVDYTREAGLAKGRNLFSGFGVKFFDYDNDGWLDLFVANGHILDNISAVHPEVEYAERNLVLRNMGGGRFEDVSARMGRALDRKEVSRGLAIADFDNDGDMDVAISNNGQSGVLLRNEQGHKRSWIAFQLIGRESSRDAVGAKVFVEHNGMRQVRMVKGGTSYLSTSDARVYFGLGDDKFVDKVEVDWPSGRKEVVGRLRGGRVYAIEEGQGIQDYPFSVEGRGG